MTTYKLGLSADSKTAYVTVSPEPLPGGATNALTDIVHGAAGDKIGVLGSTHALYSDIQDAVYREEAIQDMQHLSIVKSGKIWGAIELHITPVADIDLSVGTPATLVIKYAYGPGNGADQTATNTHFTYVSSVPAKATVSSAGVITPVAVGATVITVTQANSGLVATVNVNVVA